MTQNKSQTKETALQKAKRLSSFDNESGETTLNVNGKTKCHGTRPRHVMETYGSWKECKKCNFPVKGTFKPTE